MGIALNESASAPLHAWMSMVRLLMQVHPRVGASVHARFIGDTRGQAFQPGWNCVHRAGTPGQATTYIWIATDGSHGRTTANAPDVPANTITQVDENALPAFEDTAAWRVLMELRDTLDKRLGLAALTQRHMATLDAASKAPLRGGDPSVDARIARVLGKLGACLNSPAGTRVGALEEPLREVVDEYLDLRLTRRHASNILAVVLAKLILQAPPIEPGGREKAFFAQVDYLSDLATRLRDERHDYDLAGFYMLTCLAALWAETVQIMAKQIAKQAPPDVASKLEKRARFVDEMSVHELMPSLSQPMVLAPPNLSTFMAATVHGLASLKGVYRGAGITDPAKIEPEKVWTNIEAYSKTAMSFPDPWHAHAPIFSEQMQKYLQMILLAGAIGRAMP